MTNQEAIEILDDVRSYLASRASLDNEKLAGHSFIDICNAIKTLKSENDNIREWLSTFKTDSATECFTAIQELRKRVEE